MCGRPARQARDALTVFDENAVVLAAPVWLVEALQRHDWHTLFVARREEWQSARLQIFGHALMDKLMQPRKAITGHVWVTEQLTDAELASSLTPERLSAKLFLPCRCSVCRDGVTPTPNLASMTMWRCSGPRVERFRTMETAHRARRAEITGTDGASSPRRSEQSRRPSSRSKQSRCSCLCVRLGRPLFSVPGRGARHGRQIHRSRRGVRSGVRGGL